MLPQVTSDISAGYFQKISYFIVNGKPLKLDILSNSLAMMQRFMEESHQCLLYCVTLTSPQSLVSGNCNVPTDSKGTRASFLAACEYPWHLHRPAFIREALKVPITCD